MTVVECWERLSSWQDRVDIPIFMLIEIIVIDFVLYNTSMGTGNRYLQKDNFKIYFYFNIYNNLQ